MEPKISVIIPVYNQEPYLDEMLDSLFRQSYQNYEAVIINDGSTDRSMDIIRKYVKRDLRFKCVKKERSGIAAARNVGIGLAAGDYALFLDPEDVLPPNALRKYARAVDPSDPPDLVVGTLEMITPNGTRSIRGARRLSRQREIPPESPEFINSWHLGTKLFSLKTIRENMLEMPDLSCCTDGIFLLQFLNYSVSIRGCDAPTCRIRIHPAWQNPTALDEISMARFRDFSEAQKRLFEEADLLYSELPEETRDDYRSRLLLRLTDAELMNGFYRSVWNLSDEGAETCRTLIEQNLNKLDEASQNRFMKRNADILTLRGLPSKQDFAEHPRITVAVDFDFSEEEIVKMARGLYGQQDPSFELVFPETVRSRIPEKILRYPNIRFSEGTGAAFRQAARQHGRGEFLQIVDAPVYDSDRTLRRLTNALDEEKFASFAAVEIRRNEGLSTRPLHPIHDAFRRQGGRFAALNRMDGDILFANKLFRRSHLGAFRFTENTPEDIATLYATMPSLRLKSGTMLTEMTQEALNAIVPPQKIAPRAAGDPRRNLRPGSSGAEDSPRAGMLSGLSNGLAEAFRTLFRTPVRQAAEPSSAPGAPTEKNRLSGFRVILASQSPRRANILENHGIHADIHPVDVDETLPEGISPEDAVRYLALKKGLACEELFLAAETSEKDRASGPSAPHFEETEGREKDDRPPLILSADTIVYKDTILGKPADADEAASMLRRIRGTSHRVLTGVCLILPGKQCKHVFCDETAVTCADYSDDDIAAYIEAEKPFDKAGAYAIQGPFARFVEHLDGSRENVIGLPFEAIERELETWPDVSG